MLGSAVLGRAVRRQPVLGRPVLRTAVRGTAVLRQAVLGSAVQRRQAMRPVCAILRAQALRAQPGAGHAGLTVAMDWRFRAESALPVRRLSRADRGPLAPALIGTLILGRHWRLVIAATLARRCRQALVTSSGESVLVLAGQPSLWFPA